MPARLARSAGSPVHRPCTKRPAVLATEDCCALAVLDLGGQGRIDGEIAIGGKRDEALRQIEIAGRQRRADVALRNIAIEGAVERPIADFDRIVRRGKLVTRGNAAAHEHRGNQRE